MPARHFLQKPFMARTTLSDLVVHRHRHRSASHHQATRLTAEASFLAAILLPTTPFQIDCQERRGSRYQRANAGNGTRAFQASGDRDLRAREAPREGCRVYPRNIASIRWNGGFAECCNCQGTQDNWNVRRIDGQAWKLHPSLPYRVSPGIAGRHSDFNVQWRV